MSFFNGKTAIVTGGAASIGGAISAAFLDAGAHVVAAARSAEQGDVFLKGHGDSAAFIQTDITDDDQLDRLIDETTAQFGGIDFVINNAAVVNEAGLGSNRAQWMETFNVNVFSMALLVEKALPHLRASSAPAVVNIGSCTASVGIQGLVVYPTTKAAIHQLTRELAVALAPDGIRVNTVAPGATMSDPLDGLTGGNRALADDAVAPLQPLGGGRLVNAEEVAKAALFLCSDAASFTTGSTLAVDGGYSAMGPEARTPVIERILAKME